MWSVFSIFFAGTDRDFGSFPDVFGLGGVDMICVSSGVVILQCIGRRMLVIEHCPVELHFLGGWEGGGLRMSQGGCWLFCYPRSCIRGV